MRDYEQLYYDLLYKYEKIKKEKEILEQEIGIYKSISHKNNLKQEIAEMLSKYLKK